MSEYDYYHSFFLYKFYAKKTQLEYSVNYELDTV